MSVMTFQRMRDLIYYDLGDMAEGITDTKIAMVFADITREIVIQLEAQESYKSAVVEIESDTGTGAIPTDATLIKRVSLVDPDGNESFLNMLLHDDIESRKWHSDKNVAFVYCLGRTIHTSWSPASDTDFKVYYYPFFDDMELPVGSTKFGSSEQFVPIQLTRAFRYGVLGDLVLVHGKGQEEYIKATIYDRKYKEILDWASQNVKKVMPPYEFKAHKDY